VRNGINLEELKEALTDFDKERIIGRLKIPVSPDLRIIAYVGDTTLPYYKPECILDPLKGLLTEGLNLYMIFISQKKDENLEILIKRKGLESRVRFISLPHLELIKTLMACDVGFYALQEDDPQTGYAIGAKVLEYMSVGLPILAVIENNSTLSKLINHYGNGIAVTWNEKDKLANSLRNMLIQNGEINRNAKELVPTFSEMFDSEEEGRKLLHKIMEIKQ
jgi:glycosyltransferase involved in cell wall biosynthesis